MNAKTLSKYVFLRSLIAILLVGFSTRILADQVVLYTVPSPSALNWRTPHTLLKTVLQNHNSGQAHKIGNLFVGIYCSDLGIAGQADVLMGMTSAVDKSKELLRDQGYGLGGLFHNVEGRLKTSEEATSDIQQGVQSGRFSFMAFDIRNATCQRLLSYEIE